MKRFFKSFFRENKAQIIISSFFRLFAFVQVLFWPYAFSKIVNIISANPERWREAILWTMLMIANKAMEDFIRLRSKFGLEKIGADLKISLAIFFSHKTEVQEGRKTGEAVQAVKRASDNISSLVDFYKDNILQLPVSFIIIPLILIKASTAYFLILVIYGILYLAIDCLMAELYKRKLRSYFKADEVFWGTTYRKAPEAWRQREDGHNFAQKIHQEGQDLYNATVSSLDIDSWRWTILQALSSISLGAVILLVLYKISTSSTPVGDLILVTGYFQEAHNTFNIITSTISYAIQTRLSLKRLDKIVKIK